jgi:hypothetical protein
MRAVPGTPPLRLAAFVTPHGFGHAARACAVLSAVAERVPLALEIFTTTPEWFFADSLRVPWRYHAVRTDIGLVQRDALDEDPESTARALDAFLPFDAALLAVLAAELHASGCVAVLCDVAPLGIAAAHAAGLPAVLVENFTWDWIYRSYASTTPALGRHAETLAGWFARADLHLQTEPVCAPAPGAVRVAPVARLPRRSRAEVRRELGIANGARAVLVTMGGIGWDWSSLQRPRLADDVVLVVPGGAASARHEGWAVLLPFHSAHFHPDLVAACDGVVGKLGYSTFAETWGSGVPFGFAPRDGFAESPVLARAVLDAGAGCVVSPAELRSADWSWLERVLAMPRRPEGRARGNDDAAAALVGWLARSPRG